MMNNLIAISLIAGFAALAWFSLLPPRPEGEQSGHGVVGAFTVTRIERAAP